MILNEIYKISFRIKTQKNKHLCDFNDRNFYASTVQKTYQISHSDPLPVMDSWESLRKGPEATRKDNSRFLRLLRYVG